MTQAKKGDRVKVHLHGTLDDGSVFIETREQEPIEFTVGDQRFLPAIETSVIGMQEGDKKELRLPPENAYGARSEDKIITMKKEKLPEGVEPSVGDRLNLRTQDGGAIKVTVADRKDEFITLDANHPLAGKALNFDMELVSVDGE